jgi:hypothetical protein
VSADIVERLRRAADTSAGGGGEWYQLVHRCREAADEIERLRAAVERLHSALTPLSVYGMVDDMQELCDAFNEARRER